MDKVSNTSQLDFNYDFENTETPTIRIDNEQSAGIESTVAEPDFFLLDKADKKGVEIFREESVEILDKTYREKTGSKQPLQCVVCG